MRAKYSLWFQCFTILLSLCFTSNAGAEVEEESPPDQIRLNAVNFGFIGLLSGSYYLNYSRSLDGYHGLIGEVVYVAREGTIDEEAEEQEQFQENGFGFLLGYRYAWEGGQDSPFTGVSFDYYQSEETRDGNPHAKYNSWSLTANIGRRWAWESGFNITLRFGLGYASREYISESDQTSDQLIAGLADAILESVPVGFDGELSVGYSF